MRLLLLTSIVLLVTLLPKKCISQTRVLISDAKAMEGRNMQFVVTLNGSVPDGLLVDVSFSGISAEGEGVDFPSTPQSISFKGTNGESLVINLALPDDQVVEGDEDFSVGLSTTARDVDVSDTGKGTIQDNDVAILSIDDVKANEGEKLEFTISLDRKVKRNFIVNATLKAGTAKPNVRDSTAVGDYANVILSVVFKGEPGETQKISVHSLVDKDVAEGDENFFVHLSTNPTTPNLNTAAVGTGIISDYTDCRICPSSLYLDTVKQFNITFYGDGNLQKTVQSSEEIAATTGVGVHVTKYFRNLPKQKFGLWYRVELMAQLNVASSVDTVEAIQETINGQTVVSNAAVFGNSILTPLNSGQAVDMTLRLYNKQSYGGFFSGIELRYIGSNRNWKLNADSVGQANTNLARVILFHEIVPYQKRDDYSVMLKVGYAANWIRGDLGTDANAEVLKKFIGTDKRNYHGIELGTAFKLKNILADFAYTIFPGEDTVPGLTGSRFVTTIKFVGGFNVALD